MGRLAGFTHDHGFDVIARITCAMLALAAAWFAARIAWDLVPRAGIAADSVPVRIPAHIGAVAVSIADWHLFGATPTPTGVGSDGQSGVTALILRGTLAEPDPAAGVAVIDGGNRGEQAYRVGDDIRPGLRLVAVYPERVELDTGGVRATLSLARDRNPAPAEALAANPGSVTGGAMSTPHGAATTTATSALPAAVTAEKATVLAEFRKDPAAFANKIPIVPVIDGGKIDGVRIGTGADPALLGLIGLRVGDVVTAIDGQPVDSLARGTQIFDSLRHAAGARVTVVRNGTPTDIQVSIR